MSRDIFWTCKFETNFFFFKSETPLKVDKNEGVEKIATMDIL